MGIIVFLFAITFCYGNATLLNHYKLDGMPNEITAEDDQFPYTVSVQELSLLPLATRGHRCSGALITFQHVLTTASCIYDIVNGVAVPIVASKYRAFAGASQLTNDAALDRYRSIAYFTVHPDFSVTSPLRNDIAIITLATPFSSTTVTPIRLHATDFIPIEFSLCTVAGWGATGPSDNTSVDLKYTFKRIYDQERCTRVYNSTIGVSRTMICATSHEIISVGCLGDQGNALVCENELVGVMFYPNSCQTTAYPQLFTRISAYTTWIRSVIY